MCMVVCIQCKYDGYCVKYLMTSCSFVLIYSKLQIMCCVMRAKIILSITCVVFPAALIDYQYSRHTSLQNTDTKHNIVNLDPQFSFFAVTLQGSKVGGSVINGAYKQQKVTLTVSGEKSAAYCKLYQV